MKGWLSENLLIKLIALLLAFVLHMVVNEDREEVGVFFVKTDITLPSDQIMVNEPIDKISVSIRGKRSMLTRLRSEPIEAIRVDLSEVTDGAFKFKPEQLKLPSGLEVIAINPPSLTVELEELRRSAASVIVPPIQGAPAAGYQIVGQRVEPEKVEVIGPASRLNGVFALTEPVNLTGRTETLVKILRLRDASGRGLEFEPRSVTITIDIAPVRVERAFEGLPVEVRDTRYLIALEPERVTVTLAGAPKDMSGLDIKAITPVIDASGLDGKPPGTWKKKVEIDNLPPGVDLIHVRPAYIKLTTQAPPPKDEPE